MTEQQTTSAMTRPEFEEHHSRTWDYVARVGKIWEQIAEEQQAIIDGKGYRHLGYVSHEVYWNTEFKPETGWDAGTIQGWISAKRIMDATPLSPELQAKGVPRTYDHWLQLGKIKDPQSRAEFVENYEDFKPDGPTKHPFREAINEYKGEPVVREVLTPEDMADLPSGEFDRYEKKASLTSKIVPTKSDDPAEVAEACYRLYGDSLDTHIMWADKIATWYAKYRDELVAHQRQGIRAVK